MKARGQATVATHAGRPPAGEPEPLAVPLQLSTAYAFPELESLLDASKWLDEPANRAQAAKVIGGQQYVYAPADVIDARLAGSYELGGGHDSGASALPEHAALAPLALTAARPWRTSPCPGSRAGAPWTSSKTGR